MERDTEANRQILLFGVKEIHIIEQNNLLNLLSPGNIVCNVGGGGEL